MASFGHLAAPAKFSFSHHYIELSQYWQACHVLVTKNTNNWAIGNSIEVNESIAETTLAKCCVNKLQNLICCHQVVVRTSKTRIHSAHTFDLEPRLTSFRWNTFYSVAARAKRTFARNRWQNRRLQFSGHCGNRLHRAPLTVAKLIIFSGQISLHCALCNAPKSIRNMQVVEYCATLLTGRRQKRKERNNRVLFYIDIATSCSILGGNNNNWPRKYRSATNAKWADEKPRRKKRKKKLGKNRRWNGQIR